MTRPTLVRPVVIRRQPRWWAVLLMGQDPRPWVVRVFMDEPAGSVFGTSRLERHDQALAHGLALLRTIHPEPRSSTLTSEGGAV